MNSVCDSWNHDFSIDLSNMIRTSFSSLVGKRICFATNLRFCREILIQLVQEEKATKYQNETERLYTHIGLESNFKRSLYKKQQPKCLCEDYSYSRRQ